jgi:hypothetical protein
VDEGAADAFMLIGLGMTGPKTVKHLIKTAKGETDRKRRSGLPFLTAMRTLAHGLIPL